LREKQKCCFQTACGSFSTSAAVAETEYLR
jgi:hypothetical protein